MSEEAKEKPYYCPYCHESDVSLIGIAETGEWVIRCEDCGKLYAIKNVTGKVKVEVRIEE